MRLDYIPAGYEAPFVYGAVTGIYKKYGINLQWGWGNGSSAAVKYVLAGKVMFGDGDSISLLKTDAAGGHLKMVFGYIQQSPNSVVVRASSPIKTAQELKNRTIGANPGSSGLLLLPAVLHNAGLSMSQVHIDNMQASQKSLSLLTGKVDGILDYGFEIEPELAAKGTQTRTILFSQYGVNPIDLGIVTSNALIQKDPQLVKAFVAATQASVLATEQHPNTAMTTMIKYANGTAPSKAILLAQWKGAVQLFQTANDKGHPVGWMSSKDWNSTESLAKKYLGLKNAFPVSQIYTNQFVPAAAQ